jgi:DNA polymerase-3 subunit epsilon
VLPAHLDPSLIDRLPEAPGVYVLHGEHNAILHIGKAANLQRHLIEYFRIDRTSAKAAAISHLVRNITWRTTRGAIGAWLQRAALAEAAAPAPARPALYSWRLRPGCVSVRRARRARRRHARRRRALRIIRVRAQSAQRAGTARDARAPLPCGAWHHRNAGGVHRLCGA